MPRYGETEATLDDTGFTFLRLPTRQQTARFEYVVFDYVENNPGIENGVFSSYVGEHYDDDGNISE